MSKHTPEPWRVGRPGTVVSDTPVPGMVGSDAVEYYGGNLIGESITEANALRIVACVNACAGMEDPAKEIAELKRQRDDLVSALQGMIDIASDSQGVAGYHLNGEVADWDEFEEWQAACDAIAKIKGGAA